MDDLPGFAANAALATLLGTLIGLERHRRHHSAGIRTNALVCLGASIFVSLTRLLNDTTSPTRIASYIVSGVGFLGGGVILKEGSNVRGLATAAGLWCSAAVGTLAGSGYALHAIVGTAFVLGVLLVLRPLAKWVDRARGDGDRPPGAYHVKVLCAESAAPQVRESVARHLGAIPGATVTAASSGRAKRKRVALTAKVALHTADERAVQDAVARVLLEPGVSAASWEKLAHAE